MENLETIAQRIMILKGKIISKDKFIYNLTSDKNEVQESINKVLLEVDRQVYFNPELKNEKQRDIVKAELLQDNHIYQNFKNIFDKMQLEIVQENFLKEEIKSEYDYNKNLLKIAEIESLRGKD